MVVKQPIDTTSQNGLVARAAAGDHRAAKQLIDEIWPQVEAFVRANASMGSFAKSEDHVRDVVQRVMHKLDSRWSSYLVWQQNQPTKTRLDWIRIVTKNTIRDHVRSQLGPRRAPDQPSPKRLLAEFASSELLEDCGERPPFTLAETARELFEFAQRRLSPEQLRVLALWLDGFKFEEIAVELGVSPKSAQQLLNSGVAILRRQFRGAPGSA